MQELWKSLREVVSGPVALILAGIGTVLTGVTVVQTLRGRSGWMWAFFLMLALALLVFRAFHQKRAELAAGQEDLADAQDALVRKEEQGPRLEFSHPIRLRARLYQSSRSEPQLVEVLAIPVANVPLHQEDAPALNVHVRADATFETGGLQYTWLPTWLEDLPTEEFEFRGAGPREITLPSNGRKFYVVVLAIFANRFKCYEWTREGLGRAVEDQFERDEKYWLRLNVNSSNGGPSQVGHWIEYQWPYVHVDGGRTFSAWH